MTALLRPLLLATACTLAFPSMAADRCEHSRTDQPTLDLEGITSVRVEIGADQLVVTAGTPSLRARHCASTEGRLAGSELKIERRGDVLVLGTSTASFSNFNWFRDDDYLYRDIQLALPPALALSLRVGSGDASVIERASVDLTLGSGDVSLKRIGRVTASVGSGDLNVLEAGSLQVEIGSGDAVAETIDGAVSVRVGSGDAVLRQIGSLASARVGSGGIVATGIQGDARIRSVGSGDIRLKDVAGRVNVGSIGSGDVSLDTVGGDVHVIDKDAFESLSARRIAGTLTIGN